MFCGLCLMFDVTVCCLMYDVLYYSVLSIVLVFVIRQ